MWAVTTTIWSSQTIECPGNSVVRDKQINKISECIDDLLQRGCVVVCKQILSNFPLLCMIYFYLSLPAYASAVCPETLLHGETHQQLIVLMREEGPSWDKMVCESRANTATKSFLMIVRDR